MWIKIIRSNRFPRENGEVERIRTSLSFLKEKRNRTKINFLLSVGRHVNDIFPFRARHDRNSIPRPPGWKSSSLPPVPLIRPRRRLRATRADFKATINSPFDTRVRDRGHHSPSSPSLSFLPFPRKTVVDSATVPRTRRMRRHIFHAPSPSQPLARPPSDSTLKIPRPPA